MQCRPPALPRPEPLQILEHVARGQDEEGDDGEPPGEAKQPQRVDNLEHTTQNPESNSDPECDLSRCAQFHGVPPTQTIMRRLIVLRTFGNLQG
jgi:hypothetical protein